MLRRQAVRLLLTAVTMGSAALVATTATAQQYPSKPIRAIVPFPPGSTPDIVGRLLADKLREAMGQPVVVENRTGAGGNIGTAEGARAPSDGSTILFSINGPIAVNKALYANLPFDPDRDLTPVSLLVAAPQMLAVNPALPVTDFKSFIQYSRQNPGKLTYGSVGAGSASHLTMELLKEQAGFFAVHLPYRGFPQVVQDLLGNNIDATVALVPAVMPQVQAGRLRALAVTGERRSVLAPDVPTISELGFPKFDARAWIGLLVPAGTPQPIVDRLSTETRRAMQDPALRDMLQKQGFEVIASTPQEFTRFIRDESAKWGAVVRATGAKAE
jgi:tripartite-type tricarboxylate transporter receptor subunit TctC